MLKISQSNARFCEILLFYQRRDPFFRSALGNSICWPAPIQHTVAFYFYFFSQTKTNYINPFNVILTNLIQEKESEEHMHGSKLQTIRFGQLLFSTSLFNYFVWHHQHDVSHIRKRANLWTNVRQRQRNRLSFLWNSFFFSLSLHFRQLSLNS